MWYPHLEAAELVKEVWKVLLLTVVHVHNRNGESHSIQSAQRRTENGEKTQDFHNNTGLYKKQPQKNIYLVVKKTRFGRKNTDRFSETPFFLYTKSNFLYTPWRPPSWVYRPRSPLLGVHPP